MGKRDHRLLLLRTPSPRLLPGPAPPQKQLAFRLLNTTNNYLLVRRSRKPKESRTYSKSHPSEVITRHRSGSVYRISAARASTCDALVLGAALSTAFHEAPLPDAVSCREARTNLTRDTPSSPFREPSLRHPGLGSPLSAASPGFAPHTSVMEEKAWPTQGGHRAAPPARTRPCSATAFPPRLWKEQLLGNHTERKRQQQFLLAP